MLSDGTPIAMHSQQDQMVNTRQGQLISQQALMKKQDNDIFQLRMQLHQLSTNVGSLASSSSLQGEELRWHPQDTSKPYTWNEFWTEAERQINANRKKGGNSKPVTSDDITKKATDMWNKSQQA